MLCHSFNKNVFIAATTGFHFCHFELQQCTLALQALLDINEYVCKQAAALHQFLACKSFEFKFL